MNWAIKARNRVDTMIMATQLGQITLPVWGFDPALSIALNLAYSDGLVEPTKTGFKNTDKGKELVKKIMSDGTIMIDEKAALISIGRKITEDMVKTVSKEWE
ncbi:hypothetical protein [Pseudomonas syringae]|uniref:hypothetical protein n=1 Tax=Pseudomonas syringae TaxID=317 RepID=UPI003F7508E5